MKISPRINLATGMNRLVQAVRNHNLVLVLALVACPGFVAAQTNQTFGTPEEAVGALVAAADQPDSDALHSIFGSAALEMESPDRIQATNEQNAFASSLKQGTQIVRESDSRCVVEVGERHWPFPIPIVKKDGRW